MNQNNQDQEIDLAVVSRKISGYIDSIGRTIFNVIKFVRRNIFVIGILFILGIVLGYFMDKSNNSYTSQIVVAPNFGSYDNLYAKVDLLQSRIAEEDETFLKQIGITNTTSIIKIEIEPIVDIYNFVNSSSSTLTNTQNTQNFELVKLLAEDGDINKVVKDKLTSKNYGAHLIKISSIGKIADQKDTEALFKFLNDMPYYENIRKTFTQNIEVKMKENQVIIDQINGLLNQFSNTSTAQKSDKLVYYNENNQLNDIITSKNNFVAEIGRQKLDLINYAKVINPLSIVLNQKNTKGTNGKMKLVLPIFFLSIFFVGSLLAYIHHIQKRKYA